MKITRTIDGKEHTIVLTNEELERAYRIRESYYQAEDVKLWWYNNHDEDELCPFSDEECGEIANYIQDELESGNNENYNECYWDLVATAIDKYQGY